MYLIKKLTREYFTFHKKEKQSLVSVSILALILLICFIGQHFFLQWQMPEHAYLRAEVERLNSNRKGEKSGAYPNAMKQKISLSSQKFHVNEMDQNDWVALGLSQKQAEVTTKLIKKKQVHKFEELLDIKFIPPFIKEKYQKQFDFRIKPRTQAAKVNQEKSTIHEKFDLNSINSKGLRTSCEMDSLEIKSFFIYRKRLGGFQSENQIAEIAGIDSVSKRILMEYGLADTGLITKIPINHISIKDLSKHPYFSYNLATAIVNYRYKHGPYQSVGDLKKLVVMTPELFEKIRHYIRTEP